MNVPGADLIAGQRELERLRIASAVSDRSYKYATLRLKVLFAFLEDDLTKDEYERMIIYLQKREVRGEYYDVWRKIYVINAERIDKSSETDSKDNLIAAILLTIGGGIVFLIGVFLWFVFTVLLAQ